MQLSASCKRAIASGRDALVKASAGDHKPVYGVNTGFGSLYNVRISEEATDRLQVNLIRSHAAGTGPVVPYPIARLVVLLKILNFCPGNSGVRVELVQNWLMSLMRG